MYGKIVHALTGGGQNFDKAGRILPVKSEFCENSDQEVRILPSDFFPQTVVAPCWVYGKRLHALTDVGRNSDQTGRVLPARAKT